MFKYKGIFVIILAKYSQIDSATSTKKRVYAQTEIKEELKPILRKKIEEKGKTNQENCVNVKFHQQLVIVNNLYSFQSENLQEKLI